MDAFELDDLRAQRARSGQPYLEFLRRPDLSAGLYVLPPRGIDRQQPHTEDEIYHVLAGRARVTVGDETRTVTAGSVVFVAAHVPHRFHDIEEELALLVVFAPAQGARAGEGA